MDSEEVPKKLSEIENLINDEAHDINDIVEKLSEIYIPPTLLSNQNGIKNPK